MLQKFMDQNKVGEVSDERRCSRGEIIRLMHSALLQNMNSFLNGEAMLPIFSPRGKQANIITFKHPEDCRGLGWVRMALGFQDGL
jgi:hypothetical protein